MARRTKQASLETRENVLDAALEVFGARGVSQASLSDVATAAGVTRGAIYGHFDNKADLFSALLDRTLLPFDAMWSCKCSGGPLEHLRAACVFLLRETATNPRWRSTFHVVFHKCEKLEENGAIVQRLTRERHEAVRRMTELVVRAIAVGELPADLQVPEAVELLRCSLVGLMSQWLLQPGSLDLAAYAEPFAQALLHMLRTAPSLRASPG